MIDLNLMSKNIQSVLENVPGIKVAYDHEPQKLTTFPAATVFFDGFEQTEGTTRRSTVNLRWTIRLYIALNTSDVKTPQFSIREFIVKTIKQFRTDLSLGGSCLYHTISSGDVFVNLEQNNPMLVAELTLTATTEEFM